MLKKLLISTRHLLNNHFSPLSAHIAPETTVPTTALADVSSFTVYSVEIEFLLNYKQSVTPGVIFFTHSMPIALHCGPELQYSSGLTCAASVFVKCQERLPCHLPYLTTTLTLIICI